MLLLGSSNAHARKEKRDDACARQRNNQSASEDLLSRKCWNLGFRCLRGSAAVAARRTPVAGGVFSHYLTLPPRTLLGRNCVGAGVALRVVSVSRAAGNPQAARLVSATHGLTRLRTRHLHSGEGPVGRKQETQRHNRFESRAFHRVGGTADGPKDATAIGLCEDGG